MDDGCIAQALANHFAAGSYQVARIEALDRELHGHAFKYAEGTSRLFGVYPYRVELVDDHGVTRVESVMVKAKPSHAQMMRIYAGLLAGGGIELVDDIETVLQESDYVAPNVKEVVLFETFGERLAPYLPTSLGAYVDPADGYTLRIEKQLPPGSVILDPDDDTTQYWRPSYFSLVVDGLADIHARFFGDTTELLATGYVYACTSAVMSRGIELWEGLFQFVRRRYPEVVAGDVAQRHRTLIDTLPDWYAAVDGHPKTLLYGDVNPQNLAFSSAGGTLHLCLFDWERAIVALPQRDLAEFLVYTLPAPVSVEAALAVIEGYRDRFAATGGHIGGRDFYEGFVLMLDDLIINSLPLMMLVAHVTGKRPHAAAAYLRAHQLVDALTHLSHY